MTQCDQCKSEITGGLDDAFCPYCGTSLKITESETLERHDEIAIADDEKTAIETNLSVSEFADEHRAPDLAEIEAPDSDGTEAEETFAGNQDDLPAVDISIGKNERANDGEMQSESALMSYEELEVKEGAAVEEINHEVFNESGERNRNIEQDESIQTAVKQLPFIAPAGSENDGSSSAAAAAPIVKPETEWETPENDESLTRFDSVRIMQPEARAWENNEDEKKSEADKSGVSAVAKTVDVDSGKSEKPNATLTTPNIGVNTDGKKSSKLKPLDEGTVLNNRYEIIRKIGGGGMGAVYLASDKNLGGVLRAVKEMVQSYIEGEQHEKAIADFKRESVLLTSLEHNSIPTIYDYFFDEQEARFYLVMKYISGGDLSMRLRAAPEHRIDEQAVTEWAIQIADVLDYLHNRQPPIVYRDLKPANVMVDGNSGRAMLIDFGIARWINKEEKGVTAVGTMGYAPPELFSGNVEPRSDIYSLGSTLFHLLTGADPQNNPLLIFDFQKNPRPRQINPQLSDQIEKILMRAVEYSADKRFASAAELRRTLETHLENLKSKKVTYGVREVPESVPLSEQSVFCGFCGQKIVATDMFCAFCGSKQPMAREGVHASGYSSRNTTAQLLIVGTNELETPAFTIEKDENLVGRRDPMSNIFPEVDLSKYDPQTKISRRHARIRRSGDRFSVEDLGSSNGTVVMPVIKDTVRLKPHQPFVLTNGDKLKIGDTTLHFIIG